MKKCPVCKVEGEPIKIDQKPLYESSKKYQARIYGCTNCKAVFYELTDH